MKKTIGTCGNCGGRVSIPEAWLGITPPIPTCESCHTEVDQPHGPALKMKPARRYRDDISPYDLSQQPRLRDLFKR
jgi:hypothetical protein